MDDQSYSIGLSRPQVDEEELANMVGRLEMMRVEENDESPQHGLQNSPLITHETLCFANHLIPQCAVIGSILHQNQNGPDESRLYLNKRVPFSAIVCGVQVSSLAYFGC